ncbi:ribonuclease III [Granulosicoccus antarcticus]|uniref:Ribonuclease 3 n=1 Tax=Granulosicoccus antarcticus IMCC3135 TaxID=1192854 RepID=A0A2Z2P3R0_9GAMM|nr:ribonuclease III [Granulosicoccus antarcticus]ASJ74454.1 Ribonuclease 3 [Granulosicoccus antarcticus IMCC3135]
MADLGILLKQLDYRFKDSSLLDEALSHRSSGSHNYERLEFLGDSFLNFVIAAELYNSRPDEDEGALSRLRASLVRQSTLAEIARELNLGDFMNLGIGELRSGGFRRDSILSDVVESIIGAVFMDSGHEAARALILRLYKDRVVNLPPSAELKDPKTRLQELLQGRSLSRPEYEVVDASGKSHDMSFTVACTLPELTLKVRATATSRRKAEQAAAARMLEDLQQQLNT